MITEFTCVFYSLLQLQKLTKWKCDIYIPLHHLYCQFMATFSVEAYFESKCTSQSLLVSLPNLGLYIEIDCTLQIFLFYSTVWTIKSFTFFPSNRGTVWLCMKITPHWKAVNQRHVYLFGWYLRIMIGCGTGRRPT